MKLTATGTFISKGINAASTSFKIWIYQKIEFMSAWFGGWAFINPSPTSIVSPQARSDSEVNQHDRVSSGFSWSVHLTMLEWSSSRLVDKLFRLGETGVACCLGGLFLRADMGLATSSELGTWWVGLDGW